MEDYAGRVLADRYRLPLAPSDALDLVETRAFDTYSGQEVVVRQVPLPEVVDAEFLDGDAAGDGYGGRGGGFAPHRGEGRATRRPADPAVRRAVEAAQAAAQIPDHPRLDQVFDVFAEAGSLWIVSELVAARPLAALLAEGPLNPYRAAEIGADVLTALRALHAHGWTHRNITPRTVLVCDDGRVVLTGLAAGAAEEALCGYAPVPAPEEDGRRYDAEPALPAESGFPADAGFHVPPEPSGETEWPEQDPHPEQGPSPDPHLPAVAGRPGPGAVVPGARARPEIEPYPPRGTDASDGPGPPAASPAADVRAARAGAIAAYRAGARAAARIGEAGALPAGRRGPAPDSAGPATDPTPDPDPAPGTDSAGGRDRNQAHGPGPSPGSLGEASHDPSRDPGRDLGPGRDDAPALPAYPTPVPAQGLGPEPRWWSQAVDDEDDEDDDEDRRGGYGDGGRPPRALLTGSWSDGPHASRDGGGPIPAGGSGSGARQVLPGSGRPALPAGYAPAQAPAPAPGSGSGGWDDETEADESGAARRYGGPATRLDAERARQTRIAVIGAVTERWAPEQAAPVHENWRLAPPIGPVTDLWALGALLYRAVQGHAPYPEDSAAELVQLVCAEPPAFAEECGPLRPVVESLLRQDPTERPDFEELRGWLRSLVRSAPEPEAGVGVVPLPSFDATRLPVVRRRGELVRRRRAAAAGGRHRHRKGRQPARPGPAHEPRRSGRTARPAPGREFPHEEFHEELPQRAPRAPKAARAPKASGAPRSPRSLGRTLLLLILLLLGGAVAYAVMFMPKEGAGGQRSAGQTGGRSAEPSTPSKDPAPTSGAPGAKPTPKPGATPGRTAPPAATTPPAAGLAAGYRLRTDPEGFQVGVADGWRRSPINDAGQVRYTGGDFTLIVVPGRDTVQADGSDPMAYQRTKERELQPWRDSSWSSASGLRRIDVGRQAMAVGEFTWQDSTGRMVFVRNLALIERGRYHVVQVIGPENERDKVSEIYDQAVKVYRATR
ncbi:serine/threonine protein kinase [Streptomyces sp. NPDC053755]|uniref:serine/threonine protein kinase n=1 Tax=Streptomyces sp. NPDC053755 TaxID=3155815 RepID=UPI00343B4AC9